MTLIMTYVPYLRQTKHYVIPKDAQAAIFGSKFYALLPGSPGIPSVFNTHYTEDHGVLTSGLNVS